MTTKEKAKELVNRFEPHQSDDYLDSNHYYHAIQCTLICVDEMYYFESSGYDYEECNHFTQERLNYLDKIKEEINKL